MSVIIAGQAKQPGFQTWCIRPALQGAVRERAIDAFCFLISLAGAGVLALAVVAAAELMSVRSP